jgi:phosphate starvation-inducible PhoH-like protein
MSLTRKAFLTASSAGRTTFLYAMEHSACQKEREAQKLGDSSILSGAGHSKVLVVAKNDEQKELLKSVRDHIITFATGPAGTGKTLSVGRTRVAVLVTNKLQANSFHPPRNRGWRESRLSAGDVMEKIEPYMIPSFTRFTS